MAVRILVVDADPTVQRALGNALTQAGYQAIAVSDGSEALRVARADRPALVLIAANLPGYWRSLLWKMSRAPRLYAPTK